MFDERQLAQTALQLLQRVDLKGNEVPAFVEVSNWLTSKTEPPAPPPATEEPEPDPGD